MFDIYCHFALVFSTVVIHGFSIGWLAKKLGLSSEGKPGVIIVGSNRFSVSLANLLEELKIPTIVTDSSWEKLSKARKEGVTSGHCEILSEQTEYSIDFTPYDYLVSATEFDSYNALVCSTFVPDFGRNNVYRLSTQSHSGDAVENIDHTIGGRVLFSKEDGLEDLIYKINSGYVFRTTTLTKQYDIDAYKNDREHQTIVLLVIKQSNQIEFVTEDLEINAVAGDKIISLTPPSKEFNKIREKLSERETNKSESN